MKNKKAFTLIELLVVIAIVGLLASIVLISMQGVRERARIARGLDFSHSLQNSIGAYAIGVWSFETIESGNKVIDGSGNGNDGTVYGASLVAGLEQLGNALSFNGVNDYVDLGLSENLQPDTYTLEMWIKPVSLTGWGCIFGNHYPAAPGSRRGYGFRHYNGTIFAETSDGSGNGISVNRAGTLNTWQHLAMVHTFNDSLDFYYNGELVGSTSITGITKGTANLNIGRNGSLTSEKFNGLIDEVRIYERSLSAAEIQKHYAEGLEKHKNLVKK